SSGAPAGDARGQALAPAAVSGDQVIHDLAGENNAVGLHDLPVNLHGVAETGCAQRHEVRLVGANVIEIADAEEDLVAEDGSTFRLRLRAVYAQGEDDENIAIRHTGAIQRSDDWWQQEIGSREARNIVDDDRHLF